MIPVRNALTNRVLGAPQDWNEEEHGPCKGLPVFITDDPYIFSYWKLSWKERLQILFGYSVRLCVVSTVMSPVELSVTKEG